MKKNHLKANAEISTGRGRVLKDDKKAHSSFHVRGTSHSLSVNSHGCERRKGTIMAGRWAFSSHVGRWLHEDRGRHFGTCELRSLEKELKQN